jgi:hypothetical protein
VTAGLWDVVSWYRFCRISELVEAVEYRTELRECIEVAMSLLRKIEALVFFRPPPILGEAVQPLASSTSSPQPRTAPAYLAVGGEFGTNTFSVGKSQFDRSRSTI